MSNSKRILLMVSVLAILGVACFVYVYRITSREEAQIRNRYQQMVSALSSGDTNAALALIAPNNRGGGFGVLTSFTQPLGPRSSVSISRSEAQVCPERVFHYGIVPGGHTIDLVKVEGQWFFTGGVNVD